MGDKKEGGTMKPLVAKLLLILFTVWSVGKLCFLLAVSQGAADEFLPAFRAYLNPANEDGRHNCARCYRAAVEDFAHPPLATGEPRVFELGPCFGDGSLNGFVQPNQSWALLPES